jgi:hypothetical protein
MKTILLRVAAAVAIMTLGQALLWGAEEIPWPSAKDQVKFPQSQLARLQSQTNPFHDEDPLTPAKPEGGNPCYQDSCNADSCFGGLCEGCAPTCEQCPRLGLVGSFGFDSFHGFSDGDFQSKFGAVTGLSAGGPVPGLKKLGVGWQFGSTFGVYDWDGRATGFSDAQSMQQVFLTAGFFRKPAEGRLSLGLVYDWMIANNWGVFAVSPSLSQWRAQAEYAFSECNGVGVWGTLHDRAHVQNVAIFGNITDRAVDQIDFFWHHKFCCGADGWLWMGIPDHTKLSDAAIQGGAGSLGEFIIGGNVQIPLSSQLALYGNMQYMRPTAAAGEDASRLQGYDIGVGILWYPGRNACTSTVNGSCWTPYLPMANNANFLVDQNKTF